MATLAETLERIELVDIKDVRDHIQMYHTHIRQFVPVPDITHEESRNEYLRDMLDSDLSIEAFAEQSGYREFEVGILFQRDAESEISFGWFDRCYKV